MFFITLPFPFLDTACGGYRFACPVSFIVREFTYVLIPVGPRHLTVLTVSLAILPSAYLLTSISPLHVSRAVHDVIRELSVVFGLCGPPLVEAFATFNSIYEIALISVSVYPCFESFTVFLVVFKVSFISISIGLY